MVSLVMWLCLVVPPPASLDKCWSEGWCGGTYVVGEAASRGEACKVALAKCEQEFGSPCTEEEK